VRFLASDNLAGTEDWPRRRSATVAGGRVVDDTSSASEARVNPVMAYPYIAVLQCKCDMGIASRLVSTNASVVGNQRNGIAKRPGTLL
jgi:hypothetical protein